MKLSLNNIIAFKRNIIDSHTHIGRWRGGDGAIYDTTPDFDCFIKSTLDNGDTVEKVVVSNLDCMVSEAQNGETIKFVSNEIQGNKRLLEIIVDNPKVAMLATCQPGYGKVENIKALFAENSNRFIGLKFHPEQLKLDANSTLYRPYMDFAREKNLVCLFHGGNSYDVVYPDGGIAKASSYAKPEQIYELAREYKDVPVVIAHWGGDGAQNFEKTTDIILQSLKNKDANLYGDISWVDCNNSAKPNLKKIIERMKNENALDRVIFGTDAPLGRFGGVGENGISPQKAYSNLIDDIKQMIHKEFPTEAEDIIDKIFYKNANGLFFNKIKPPATTDSEVVKSVKSNFIKPFALLASIIIVGLGIYSHNKKNKKTNIDAKNLNSVA